VQRRGWIHVSRNDGSACDQIDYSYGLEAHIFVSTLDYSNVNQCMKFASKTEMETASFNDVEKASQQGTLNAVKVVTGTATTMLSRPVVDVSTSFVFLGISILFFLVGCYMLVRSWKKSTEENNALKEPLVSSDGVVA
jgi:hypothetical protein